MIPTKYLRPMRALTVWQPWASLLACGAKHCETRSWPPKTLKAGDLLAIHAAKRPVRIDEWNDVVWRELFAASGGVFFPRGMRLGKVIAVCRFEWHDQITDCNPVRTPAEEAIGDWTPGRFAWRIEPVHIFDPPIPAQGKQGLWTWTPPSAAEREA